MITVRIRLGGSNWTGELSLIITSTNWPCLDLGYNGGTSKLAIRTIINSQLGLGSDQPLRWGGVGKRRHILGDIAPNLCAFKRVRCNSRAISSSQPLYDPRPCCSIDLWPRSPRGGKGLIYPTWRYYLPPPPPSRRTYGVNVTRYNRLNNFDQARKSQPSSAFKETH